MDEDPAVAGDHDGQRQQEEPGEGEHVVGRFLPVSDEAPPSGALSEVCWIGNRHVVENEDLWKQVRMNVRSNFDNKSNLVIS